jgi:pimeloyl-ACP methyl ester carboxylesterase
VNVPETRYASTGDSQVAYQVMGDGPIDLVFSHGFCHVELMWDVVAESSFVRSLASFSRLIRFDRRGSGASDPVAHGHFPTWEEWNTDLLAVLDAVGSRSAAIYAEAEAGPMALMFAASHPERVSGLVLSNTAARYAVAEDYPIGMSAESVEALGRFVEANWGTVDGVAVLLPGLAEASRADCGAVARLSRAAATPRMAGAQFRHIFGELDARDALALIGAPTLVLYNRYGLDDDHRLDVTDRARYSRIAFPVHDWPSSVATNCSRSRATPRPWSTWWPSSSPAPVRRRRRSGSSRPGVHRHRGLHRACRGDGRPGLAGAPRCTRPCGS